MSELTTAVIIDQSPPGHLDHQIFPGDSGALLTPARGPLGRTVFLAIPEIEESGHVRVGLEDYGPTPATISAVWPSLGHIGFTAKRHAPGPPGARRHLDSYLIHEMHVFKEAD